MVFWLPANTLERAQFVVGYFMHILISPFMNIFITVYSLALSDDFKWGKTREVVEQDEDELLDEKRPTMM